VAPVGAVPTSGQLPAAGIELIKEFEGCRLSAYVCQGNKVTIGWGSTQYEDGSYVSLGDTITQERADRLFDFHIARFWKRLVDSNVPYWGEMSDNQRGALLSFSYNLGWVYNSADYDTLNLALEAREWSLVPAALDLYVKANGLASPGLVRRRDAEADLWSR
jgi:GH24 family phage-related lysozyme (muramidase)